MSDQLLVDGAVLSLEVRGQQFKVSVDAHGWFKAHFAEDRSVSGDTLEKVRVQLMRLTKVARVKLNIPKIPRHDLHRQACQQRPPDRGRN
jgi:hypothetical protein